MVFLVVTSGDPCITMYQSGPLSQRLQRHPPPQDRSKRRADRDPAGSGVEPTSRVRSQPWSFKQPPVSSSGTTAFNMRLGQAVDMGRSLMLVATLKEMKELGLKPDILTYNSAMELFGKRGMEDEAWAMVDDMKALGITPDVETYKFLLEVHLTSSIYFQAPLKVCL